MFLSSGDFDIEDRVAATEGQSIVPTSVEFGNYDEEVFGEIESFNNYEMGDFGDELSEDYDSDEEYMDGTMGRSRMRKVVRRSTMPIKAAKKMMVPKKKAPIATKPKAAPSRMTVPSMARPISTQPKVSQSMQVQRAVAARPQSVVKARNAHYKRRLLNYARRNRAAILAKQRAAAAAGKPVPTVAQAIPPQVKVQLLKQSQQAAEAQVAAQVVGKTGVNNVSVGATNVGTKIVRGKKIGHQKKAQVVKPAGQQLTAEDVAAPAAVPVSATAAKVKRSEAHPLAKYYGFSGEDEGMGFLKNLITKAKTSLKSSVDKAKSDLSAQLKTSVADASAKLASTISSDPKVQQFAVEKAKQSAAQSLAEKLLEPETQKKAAIGAAVVLPLVGFGLWKMFAK